LSVEKRLADFQPVELSETDSSSEKEFADRFLEVFTRMAKAQMKTQQSASFSADEVKRHLEEHGDLVENLKDQFSAAASSVEGSGWGMLVYENVADKLMTIQAENHNNRAVQGSRPLLVCDVWEHAFYLQYENNKGEYIDNWWDVVDWDNVAEQYDRAQEGRGA